MAFSPDGKRVVAGTGTTVTVTGAVLTCHDAATGETLWRAEEHDINILSLAYSPDGKTVASGCGGFNNYAAIGFVRLRDSATGKTIGQVPGGPGGVRQRGLQPRRQQLALANRGMVDVWDLASHSIAFQLRDHLDYVYAVTFSPDGRWIASGGWDKAIRIWDRRTGKLEHTLLGSRGFVRGLSFRPDSKQIISCSEDRGLRLWDIASGRSVASFHGHSGFVHCVAFSPDGTQAASGSMDGSIKLWPAACARHPGPVSKRLGLGRHRGLSPGRSSSRHGSQWRHPGLGPHTGEEFCASSDPAVCWAGSACASAPMVSS